MNSRRPTPGSQPLHATRTIPIHADVYCDLKRKCASIRALEGEHKGRVIAKPVFSVVHNVVFRVQPGGLARIRSKGVRQVCAFARGHAIDATEFDVASIAARGMRIHFNPYRSDYFHLDDGSPVTAAEVLAIDHKTAYVIGPSWSY